MKKVKYFIFSLICLFSCNMVFAENEFVIKSITPVYDEESSVIVTETDDKHNVIFNDKDQSVKYNVVIENTSNKDLKVESINLTSPSEDFLKYELDGLKSDDVVKANSTQEVVISLSTVKQDGWGRNFDDELTATINFAKTVVNPNTVTNEAIIVILICGLLISCSFIVIYRKKKITRYIVILLAFGSVITVTSAKETFVLPIKINVSYESQNVMTKAYELAWSDDAEEYVPQGKGLWASRYAANIKNIYIENEFNEIQTYAYRFDVSEKEDGKVIAYLVVNEEDSACYDLYLQADGIIYSNPDAYLYFGEMVSLTSIDNIKGFDTSNVTNMGYMFYNTGRYSTNLTLDLSSFDTSNVTNMSHMFGFTGHDCTNLTLDLSSFDTSNVTNMSHMFFRTGYNSTNLILDLSSFDTSNVTDMSAMFEITGWNTQTFALDVSSFNTSNVTNMRYMFAGAGNNNSTFTLDLGDKFDTSNVKSMNSMFNGTGYKSTVFTLDLGDKFDTSNVTDMWGMFSGTGYSSPNFTLDLGDKFDTSKVTNMSQMFYDTGHNSTVFTLDLGDKFDTSNVTNMGRMFYLTGYNSPVFTLDLGNKFDTSIVTNMDCMFRGTGENAKNFTLDLGDKFDTSKVTNMEDMFSETGYNSPVFTLDLGDKFDTSNVTNMSGMFEGIGFNSTNFVLDLSNFDTSKVTNMNSMFRNAGYYSSNFALDLSNFDTSNVTDMSYMFWGTGYNSTKLRTSIAIRNPNTTYYRMFSDVATKSGSQIVVNYTKETEALVDEMIKTKSIDSNVVKGVQVD